tara:strand:+ start:5869 stop:6306 length:438 start_codon:yes stop_codon:yes gene_type:complete
MRHPIDQVDALYEGIGGLLGSVLAAFVLGIFGLLTNLVSRLPVPVIPRTRPEWVLDLIAPISPILWLANVIGLCFAIYYLATGVLEKRIALFWYYAGGCGLFAPIGLYGGYWWLSLMLFTTVCIYYWYAVPLAGKLLSRQRGLSE